MSTELVEPVGWVPAGDTFGARLALVRQRMGWNAKEAAMECGIPPQSWREWENGRSPRNQEMYARKISARTGCNYLWLFAGVAPGDHGRPTPTKHLSYNTAKILAFPLLRQQEVRAA